MIATKVIAITLTGLGSAVMGSNFYLATLARSTLHAGWQQAEQVLGPIESVDPHARPRAGPRADPDVIFPEVSNPGSILMLTEGTIHSSKAALNSRIQVEACPEVRQAKASAICSDYGLHEGGPAERDVWTLCIPGPWSVP